MDGEGAGEYGGDGAEVLRNGCAGKGEQSGQNGGGFVGDQLQKLVVVGRYFAHHFFEALRLKPHPKRHDVDRLFWFYSDIDQTAEKKPLGDVSDNVGSLNGVHTVFRRRKINCVSVERKRDCVGVCAEKIV